MHFTDMLLFGFITHKEKKTVDEGVSINPVICEGLCLTVWFCLSCSSDGKLLASLGSGGPCKVWDVSSSMVLSSLSNENVSN